MIGEVNGERGARDGRGVTVRIVAPALLTVAMLWLGGADAAAQESGEAVYQANCVQCHQAGGVGVEGAFPPLAGNSNVQDAAYVRATIVNGKQGEIVVNGVTYNGAMPAFPNLSDAEIDAVIAYVQGLAGPAATTTTAATPGSTVPGDVVAFGEAVLRGESLFLGSTPFTNGGPACLACHTAGDRGNLSGSGLGPDLTHVFARLGADGLAAVMADPHPEVMSSLYTEDPLTAEEQVDLSAFLQSASGDADRGFVDGLLVLGLAGLGLLLAYLGLVRRRHHQEGRAPDER